MSESETPKKIKAEQVEIIDAQGHVIKEAAEGDRSTSNSPFFGTGSFGNIRVMKAGPLGLLLIPIVLPLVLVGIFVLMILAMLFGRSMFRVFKWKN